MKRILAAFCLLIASAHAASAMPRLAPFAAKPSDAHAPAGRPISICTEPDFWAPYSFLLDGKPAGEYAEMISRALTLAGERYTVHVQPWKRCLERAADGQFDALLGASYSKARTKDYLYPADASMDGVSAARLSQIDYVVVVPADMSAPEKLTLDTLPEPVGVPLGYLVGDTLRAAGKRTATATKHADLFHMVARGRVGSAIMQRSMAELYIAREERAGVKILEPSMWSSSHYLLFSRRGHVDQARAEHIWQALMTVRADKAAMADVKAKVDADTAICLKTPARCHP